MCFGKSRKRQTLLIKDDNPFCCHKPVLYDKFLLSLLVIEEGDQAQILSEDIILHSLSRFPNTIF